MDTTTYDLIFNEAVQLVKDIPFEEADKNLSRYDKEVKIIFDKYFEENFLNATVDIQGHHRGQFDGKTVRQIREEYEYEHATQSFQRNYEFAIAYNLFLEIAKFKDVLEEHKEKIIHDFIREIETPFSASEIFCFDCGCTVKVRNVDNVYTSVIKKEREFLFNKPSQLPCAFKGNLETFSRTISLPSGKLVFANDLREMLPEDADEQSDKYIIEKSGYYNTINSLYGQELHTDFWLSLGLIYISTGNTSPTIFKDTKTNTISAKHETIYDRENDEDVDNTTENEVEVGSVCTDVWAVCAMDYSVFSALINNQDSDEGDDADDDLDESDYIECSVDVPPGDYTLTIYRRDAHNFFTITPVVSKV